MSNWYLNLYLIWYGLVNTLPQLQKQINQHYQSLTDLLDQGINLHNTHLLLCKINKYTILILNSIKLKGYVSCTRQYLSAGQVKQKLEHKNHTNCHFAINKGHNSSTVKDITAKIILTCVLWSNPLCKNFRTFGKGKLK